MNALLVAAFLLVLILLFIRKASKIVRELLTDSE